jgi:hypothetical protein
VTGSTDETQAAAIGDQDAAFVAACIDGTPFAATGAAILPTLRVQQQVADLVAIHEK